MLALILFEQTSVYMKGPRHLAVFSGAKPNPVSVSNETPIISASCPARKQTMANFNYRSAVGFYFLWLKFAPKFVATFRTRRRFRTVGVAFTTTRTVTTTSVTHCHSSIQRKLTKPNYQITDKATNRQLITTKTHEPRHAFIITRSKNKGN